MASVHRRYACVSCMARGGEPTYFNDYQSAATHYARSQSCSKSTRGIKTVSVQLHTEEDTQILATLLRHIPACIDASDIELLLTSLVGLVDVAGNAALYLYVELISYVIS
jgi:hypothetical protein